MLETIHSFVLSTYSNMNLTECFAVYSVGAACICHFFNRVIDRLL